MGNHKNHKLFFACNKEPWLPSRCMAARLRIMALSLAVFPVGGLVSSRCVCIPSGVRKCAWVGERVDMKAGIWQYTAFRGALP
jgi:hypothetical protein